MREIHSHLGLSALCYCLPSLKFFFLVSSNPLTYHSISFPPSLPPKISHSPVLHPRRAHAQPAHDSHLLNQVGR